MIDITLKEFLLKTRDNHKYLCIKTDNETFPEKWRYPLVIDIELFLDDLLFNKDNILDRKVQSFKIGPTILDNNFIENKLSFLFNFDEEEYEWPIALEIVLKEEES